jgi:hypothetical protein
MAKKPSTLIDFNTLPQSLFERNNPTKNIAAELLELSRHLQVLRAHMFEAARSGSNSLARSFVTLHQLNENMQLLVKQFNKLMEHYKTVAVPDVLDMAGVTNVPLAEGFRVGTSSRLWASFQVENQDEGFEWLRRNGMGDLIKLTVNTQTLSSAISQHLDEYSEEPPPELIKVTVTQNTSVTRTKK